MIQLVTKSIEDSTQDRLNTLQTRVNAQTSFVRKRRKAKSQWENKRGSNIGEKAFSDIEQTLTDMCVSVGVCNYCEQNESNDIEHIHPKSFFPELAFVWENYLLACKQCNTALKLDKFYVFDPHFNAIFVNRGQEPPFSEAAFINPRTENPNNFMILNLKTFDYEIIRGLNKRDKLKAEKTIEILELDTRAVLINARRSAAKYYYERVERLVKIINSANIQEIKEHLTPHEGEIDFTQDINQIKASIEENFKNDIETHQHPSVWHSIKLVGSKTESKWKKLFAEFPEALNW